MSKTYELMIIVNADLGDEKAKEISKAVQDIITTLKGKVVKDDFWGRRKLAYEIKHRTEGFYDLLTIEIESSSIKKLKEKINLMNDVIRYLVTAVNS